MLKNAVWRHSVARLVKTPAVNHLRRVTAQSATMTKSVIGVFSRGPLEAYWMKPWNDEQRARGDEAGRARAEEVATQEVRRAHRGGGDQHEERPAW